VLKHTKELGRDSQTDKILLPFLQGDSGGPLQVKITETTAYSIVGVTSFGPGVCGGSTPGIYTRVDKYVDWIESVIWN
jgi:secreted trypsin-like serine protease